MTNISNPSTGGANEGSSIIIPPFYSASKLAVPVTTSQQIKPLTLTSNFQTNIPIEPLTDIFTVSGGSLLPIGEYVIGVDATDSWGFFNVVDDYAYYALNINTGATHYIINKYDLLSGQTILDSEYPELNYGFGDDTNIFFAIIQNKLVILLNERVVPGQENSGALILNSLSKTGDAFNDIYNAYNILDYSITQFPTYNYLNYGISYQVGSVYNIRNTYSTDFGIVLGVSLYKAYSGYEKQLILSIEIDGIRLLHTQNNLISGNYSTNVLFEFQDGIKYLNNKNVLLISVTDFSVVYPIQIRGILNVTETTATFNLLSSVDGSNLTPPISGTFRFDPQVTLDNGYVMGYFMANTYISGYDYRAKLYKCLLNSDGTISNISVLLQSQYPNVYGNFVYDWGTTSPIKPNLYDTTYIGFYGESPETTINYFTIDSNKYFQLGSALPTLDEGERQGLRFLGTTIANKSIVLEAYSHLTPGTLTFSTYIHRLNKP